MQGADLVSGWRESPACSSGSGRSSPVAPDLEAALCLTVVALALPEAGRTLLGLADQPRRPAGT
jgi:hypothetical protein